MHTPIEFYVRTPVPLFRAGTPTKPRFDYLRTMPPRTEMQIFDLKINPQTGLVDHQSGGLSLFDKPDLDFSSDWWVIPTSTMLPPGFTLTKDLTGSVFKGHYSIRAMSDLPLEVWKRVLFNWAEKHANHINTLKQAQRNV